MHTDEAEEEKMDALIKEWTAKIEYLLANAEKASAEKKTRYLEYIESLQTRKKNLMEILQRLHCSTDLAQAEFKAGTGSS
jgi:hypothetical protein